MRSLVLAAICISLAFSQSTGVIAIYISTGEGCSVMFYAETFNLTIAGTTYDFNSLNATSECSVGEKGLTYLNLKLNDTLGDDYSDATLIFSFSKTDTGYWNSEQVMLNYTASNDSEISAVADFLEVSVISEWFSFACSIRSGVSLSDDVAILLDYYQIQAYNIQNTTFSDSFQCVAILSKGAWMGIFSTFFLIVMLVFSIMMLINIQTPDRFETSKSKCLIIPHEH